ncbi:exonuclease [Achromobacter phage Motura]|uniref:Exonuclease n=1 Tax=Achromobacter phage Motura TaxID=2591403 RepID=A0A514CSD4_9CAUD|nr:exonuclease [Achromobacter phage Motura]QDH83385.1 exonuclease [Achromobacter phage Motura]
MADHVMIFDGNWYLHRAYSIAGEASPKEGVARLFLSLIARDALMNRCNKIAVAFDGDNVFRYAIYPEYKANRDKKKKESKKDGKQKSTDGIYTISLPFLQSVLTTLEIPWVQPPKHEADDVLASTAVFYHSQGIQVTLGAKDKDIHQVLRKGIRLYISDAKPEPKLVKHTTPNKKFQVPYRKMPLYQTLVGDAIDNIKGVFGPAKAKALALKYKSLKEIVAGEPDLKKTLIVNMERLKLNKRLVTLIRDQPCEAAKLPKNAHRRIAFSPQSLIDYCQYLYPKQKGLFG